MNIFWIEFFMVVGDYYLVYVKLPLLTPDDLAYIFILE